MKNKVIINSAKLEKQDLLIKIDQSATYVLNLNSTEDFSINRRLFFQVVASDLEANIFIKIIASKNCNIILEGIVEAKEPIKNCDVVLDMRAVLIDSSAHVKLIPTLKVKNNELAINHKVTIGPFSKEKMDYLMSRGLSAEEAENLLINSFMK